jgi:hypothetical protein
MGIMFLTPREWRIHVGGGGVCWRTKARADSLDRKERIQKITRRASYVLFFSSVLRMGKMGNIYKILIVKRE